MDNRSIGVYDSGMGGITLWRAIRASLPNESIIYLGDGKNCPYGDKSSEDIATYALEAVEILIKKGCKMIVVACNTATTAAISKLRALYPDTPFVGMEPAIKPACRETKSGVVAVLATKRSLESELFTSTLAKYSTGIEVIKQVGEGFVEIVEKGLEDSDETFAHIKLLVDMMASKGVDKIVLGCTHYPFLIPQLIRAINGRGIDIIEPSPAIVKRILELLIKYNIRAEEDNIVADDFITFADEEYRKRLIAKANIEGGIIL
ncbi:MAG: glutamate racemase [Rikenellaceae bacterium]